MAVSVFYSILQFYYILLLIMFSILSYSLSYSILSYCILLALFLGYIVFIYFIMHRQGSKRFNLTI